MIACLNSIKSDSLPYTRKGSQLEGQHIKKGVTLTNTCPIPLSVGGHIPSGTAFVCERGGKNTKLVYWHAGHARYERLVMPRADCQAFFIPTSARHIPVTLALHFDLSLSEHEPPNIEAGSAYFALSNIRLPNNRIILSGDIVVCDKTQDGLAVFHVHGASPKATFLLPPPDQVMLRYMSRGDQLQRHYAGTKEAVAWVH